LPKTTPVLTPVTLGATNTIQWAWASTTKSNLRIVLSNANATRLAKPMVLVNSSEYDACTQVHRGVASGENMCVWHTIVCHPHKVTQMDPKCHNQDRSSAPNAHFAPSLSLN
jgi:hypothetical protein